MVNYFYVLENVITPCTGGYTIISTHFPIEKTVKARRSIRTYESIPLSPQTKEQLSAYIAAMTNPFSIPVAFQFLEVNATTGGEKLGTYGVINGATDYVGATVADGGLALEALGYDFENLILYAASIGLGTCWLGGSFKRSAFTAAMNVRENELFPAVSPIGYPRSKQRLADTLVRKIAKSDQRKDWSEIFFNGDFSQPLTPADAGDFTFPLEMVRLGPSASNKQPWRILKTKTAYHFYKDKGYGEALGFDIQKIDMGIAACHFHLGAQEKNLPGRFENCPEPAVAAPKNSTYSFSWVIV